VVSTPTEEKYQDLISVLKDMRSVLVAFSAGVDSGFLAFAAKEALGPKAAAVTARSPSLPEAELSAARQVAQRIGIRHLVIDTQELADSRYAANPVNRCYFCKTHLFSQLSLVAKREGIAHLAYGAIPDDLSDHRPGHAAAEEFGVRSPLQEVELTKKEIRDLSKKVGLPFWDKPAMACLASRIPQGQHVTQEKLLAIERAEAYLKELRFRQLRVRHHGDLARIEVDKKELPRFFDPELMGDVFRAFLRYGFLKVSVDLKGYRVGSLNRIPVPLPILSSASTPYEH
jgi:uncharacterized protein